MMTKRRSVMIVAGEASGDQHGAGLVRAMQRRHPALLFYGIGGQALRDAGVRVLVDSAALAVVGLTEVFAKLPDLRRGIRRARHLLHTLRPDLLILIDFPDFNLYLAGVAKKLGIKVLYYISPQIWAWRKGRVNKIRQRVDHMAVILPFEAKFYRRHRVPVTFVGHPILDHGAGAVAATGPAAEGDPVVGLLPGSRDGEIERHLPVMLEAAKLMQQHLPQLKFVVSLVPTAEDKWRRYVQDRQTHLNLEIHSNGVKPVFQQSRFLIAASGTVTLEAALACVPMVIMYRVSPLSYWVGRLLIQVKHIGLANLIAGRELIPELIQDEASATRVAETALNMLQTPDRLENIRQQLVGIRDALGGAGASRRAAAIACRLLAE